MKLSLVVTGKHADLWNGGLFRKSLVPFFRRTYVLSAGFKIKTLRKKCFRMLRKKTNSSFAVKVTERSSHSFLLCIWWITFLDTYTIMELEELNWLCKHMKNVRSSQPCTSLNFCTEFSKGEVLACEYCQGIVLDHQF